MRTPSESTAGGTANLSADGAMISKRDVLVALVGRPGRDVRRPLDRDRPVADLGLDQVRPGREGRRVVDRRDPEPVARFVRVRLTVERPIGDDVRDPVALGRAVVGIRAVPEPVARRPRDHLCLAVRRLPDEIDGQGVTVGVGVVDQGRAAEGEIRPVVRVLGDRVRAAKDSGGLRQARGVVDRNGRRVARRARGHGRPGQQQAQRCRRGDDPAHASPLPGDHAVTVCRHDRHARLRRE